MSDPGASQMRLSVCQLQLTLYSDAASRRRPFFASTRGQRLARGRAIPTRVASNRSKVLPAGDSLRPESGSLMLVPEPPRAAAIRTPADSERQMGLGA